MEASVVKELVEDLEAEINNGGFDQFFFNSAGDKVSEAIIALKCIGAAHTAKIVESACAKFPGGMPPKERSERQELLLKVSPNSDAFEGEDQAFYEYQDNLAGLVANYVG